MWCKGKENATAEKERKTVFILKIGWAASNAIIVNQ
jgi:hypothetical protein